MNAIRRRVWWLLGGLTALFALLGVGDVLIGASFEPTTAVALTGRSLAEIAAESPDAYRVLDFGARGGGITLAVFAIVLTAILLFPYRSGQRWAWLTMWALPGWVAAVFVLNLVAGTAPGQTLAGDALTAPIIGVIVVALLLLDAKRFNIVRQIA